MRIFIYIAITCAVLTGCGKGKKNEPVLQPEKASLVFPEQNAVCVTGSDQSSTLSTIVFKWSHGANVSAYDVNVKNLLTGVSVTQSVTTTEISISLLKDTPYSWFVVSKSSSGSKTAQSDTWKFYNSGNGVLSHAPFPADELKPATGQTTPVNGLVTLTWNGSDVDNDILNYDVYIGIIQDAPLYKKEISNNSLENFFVKPKTTYYWWVVTRDTKGNTSKSDPVLFSVN